MVVKLSDNSGSLWFCRFFCFFFKAEIFFITIISFLMLCEILFSFCLLSFHLRVFYVDFSHELGDSLSIFLFLPCRLCLRFKSTLCPTLVRIMWMWQELMHGWVLIMRHVCSHTHRRCLCWVSSLTEEYIDNSQVWHYRIHFYTCAAKFLHPCWDPPCF